MTTYERSNSFNGFNPLKYAINNGWLWGPGIGIRISEIKSMCISTKPQESIIFLLEGRRTITITNDIKPKHSCDADTIVIGISEFSIAVAEEIFNSVANYKSQ